MGEKPTETQTVSAGGAGDGLSAVLSRRRRRGLPVRVPLWPLDLPPYMDRGAGLAELGQGPLRQLRRPQGRLGSGLGSVGSRGAGPVRPGPCWGHINPDTAHLPGGHPSVSCRCPSVPTKYMVPPHPGHVGGDQGPDLSPHARVSLQYQWLPVRPGHEDAVRGRTECVAGGRQQGGGGQEKCLGGSHTPSGPPRVYHLPFAPFAFLPRKLCLPEMRGRLCVW